MARRGKGGGGLLKGGKSRPAMDEAARAGRGAFLRLFFKRPRMFMHLAT